MNELYDQLMALVKECKTSIFFYKDVTTQFLTTARIFGYKYVTEDDWELPAAMEARGIMFEMDGEKPLRILSRPMKKFFNLHENKYTQDFDLSSTKYMSTKLDGLLISTYLDNDVLYVKSLYDIFSDHALISNGLLQGYSYKDIAEYALEAAREGYTCDFEYVSPKHRIILEYDKPSLILLGVRHNETGECLPYSELLSNPVSRKYLAETASIDWSDLSEDEIAVNLLKIEESEGIEGFVFQIEDGSRYKLKTSWYRTLHAVRDTIENNAGLFELIISNSLDDIKGLVTSEDLLNKIKAFELIYIDHVNKILPIVNDIMNNSQGKNYNEFYMYTQQRLKAINELPLLNPLMNVYKEGYDQDTLVHVIGEVFLSTYEKYVPKEYINDTNTFD